jgi:hypothetical protein
MSATAPIRAPRVYEQTGSLLTGPTLSGTVAPSAVMGVAVLTYISQIQPEPGHHPPAKPGDLPVFGLECAVIAAALFLTAKTFRL